MPILLHPSEPRCANEGRQCRMRSRCARAAAPADSRNQVVDFASTPHGNTALCVGYYALDRARADAGAKFTASIKARIGSGQRDG